MKRKRRLTTKDFIERSKVKHGDKYDYSKTEYFGKFKKLKIICPIHGEFEQEAWGHMKGRGCIDCSGFKPLTTKIFIERSKKIHGNKYDYSKTIYVSTRKKVKIICPIHGEFEQRAGGHLTGRGCFECIESRGEKSIRVFLENNNIKFKQQKIFKECKNKRVLPFDFYLPDYNICIEYDGEQHFGPIDYFGGELGFIKRKKLDKIKTKYCKNNNVILYRIKYTDNIKKILEKNFDNL